MQNPNSQINVPGFMQIPVPPGTTTTVIQPQQKTPGQGLQKMKILIEETLRLMGLEFAIFELERKNPQFSVKLRNESQQRIIIMMPPLPKTMAIISMAESPNYLVTDETKKKVIDFLPRINRKLLHGVFFINEKKQQLQLRTSHAFIDYDCFKVLLRKMLSYHLELFNRAILVTSHAFLEKEIPTDICTSMIC